MKQTLTTVVGMTVMTLYTLPMHANMIWPALMLSSAIFSSLFLVIISVVIEGFLLHEAIKNISYSKAMIVSTVGNAASALIGTIVMSIAMLFWHAVADAILGGTFNIFNSLISFVVMYLGSSFIELITIHLLFKYPIALLQRPVFLGNFITYILVIVYRYSDLKSF